MLLRYGPFSYRVGVWRRARSHPCSQADGPFSRGLWLSAAYPPDVTERDAAAGAEPWGEDPKLVELLGVQGAAEFRALLDDFPDAVGVLWALRDADGRIVDFAFGYGNPKMLRAFRLPAATRDR